MIGEKKYIIENDFSRSSDSKWKFVASYENLQDAIINN